VLRTPPSLSKEGNARRGDHGLLFHARAGAIPRIGARFAEKHLATGARARAHSPEYPWDVAKLMARKGCSGSRSRKPTRPGGQLIDAVMAIETVASVCPRSADVVQAGNFGPIRCSPNTARSCRRSATSRACSRASPDLGGHDRTGSRVRGDRSSNDGDADGAGYRVNGSKIFTTHSTHAEVMLATCASVRAWRDRSVLVDLKRRACAPASPRSHVRREWRKSTSRTSSFPPTASSSRRRFQEADRGFNVERIGNAARSLALGRYAYERARSGDAAQAVRAPAVRIQGLQWKFAEMKVKSTPGKLLLYRAAASADRDPVAEETAIAKAFCNQAGTRSRTKRCR